MTARVLTLGPADDLEALYDLMDTHHVRHVPIVDGEGDLVGLVTHRDLARNALGAQDALPLSMQQEILRRRKVREIMATEVETVEPDVDLETGAQMLLENKIGCLPVVEGEHVVGLTESDFVRRYVDRSTGAGEQERPVPCGPLVRVRRRRDGRPRGASMVSTASTNGWP